MSHIPHRKTPDSNQNSEYVSTLRTKHSPCHRDSYHPAPTERILNVLLPSLISRTLLSGYYPQLSAVKSTVILIILKRGYCGLRFALYNLTFSQWNEQRDYSPDFMPASPMRTLMVLCSI